MSKSLSSATGAAPFELVTGRLTEKSAKRNVIVFAESKGRLTPAAQLVDDHLGGIVARTLRTTRYQGGTNELARVTTQHETIFQVLVVGVGKQSGRERRDWWKTGLTIGRQVDAMGIKDATIALGELDGDEFAAATALLEGFAMALYRFEVFKSELKDHQARRFEKLTLLTSARAARLLEEEFPRLQALTNATALTRDCANLPPNVANPQFMADEAKKLEKLGVKVDVLDEKQMAKLGMNLILAVGGSAAPADQPRLVIMHYNGAPKGAVEAPVAIVGKGIMYDTGGYDIKTRPNMAGMKFDMSGAAAVLGAMQALAARKAPVNVVGVMVCAMNMIGQTPFVADSVYKSYKGLFVEIGNTDAEGRLVLADAVAYTIEKFQPAQLVDLATLTGACMAALGGVYAGLFSTSNGLANALQKAGDDVGERLWRMPVDDVYAPKTTVADINNDGIPYGGASAGANFIKRFADKTPWAHLDIAGVANRDKAIGQPEGLSGATGFGVRLLVNWLEGAAPAAETAQPARRGRGRPARAKSAAATPAKRGRPRKAAAKPPKPEGAAKRGRGRPRKTA